MCTTLISDAMYPCRALGRLGVVLPSVPYICFQAGLASQQLQKSFQERDGGKSPYGLIINFDLWAVLGGVVRMHFAHAYCACITACCTAYRMLVYSRCVLACCVCICHVGILFVQLVCCAYMMIYCAYMMAYCA